MPDTLLEVKNVSISFEKNKTLFERVSFEVREQDVLVLQGKSGCGKSTLMKCLALLNNVNGEVRFRGKTASELGVPTYRTHVLYVPQRPSLLPGSPKDFITQLTSFSAYKSRVRSRSDIKESAYDRARDISENWNVDRELWERPWTTLSGGESQRIALAVAVGLDCAEILLLDEPTSALDPDSSQRVEQYLLGLLNDTRSAARALVWITHSAEQGHRVGTRFLNLENGGCEEVPVSEESV